MKVWTGSGEDPRGEHSVLLCSLDNAAEKR